MIESGPTQVQYPSVLVIPRDEIKDAIMCRHHDVSRRTLFWTQDQRSGAEVHSDEKTMVGVGICGL